MARNGRFTVAGSSWWNGPRMEGAAVDPGKFETLFQGGLPMKMLQILLFALATSLAAPSFAQDKPSSSMEMLRQQVKADKKRLIEVNMDLTKAEAQAFWPIYDEYQVELRKVNERYTAVIVNYASEFNANSLTDEKALRLIDRMMMVEQDDTTLEQTIVPKLSMVLPGKKVARYVQLENKIRALDKYDLAEKIPLAQ